MLGTFHYYHYHYCMYIYIYIILYSAIEKWPSRNSGHFPMNNGDFPCFLYVYQRVNLHFPMVFLWFSYGFPMVFLWFSYGFPMKNGLVLTTIPSRRTGSPAPQRWATAHCHPRSSRRAAGRPRPAERKLQVLW